MVHHKCLVIGHRGAMGYEPENTMRSFRLAHEMKADGIELDVFLTRDEKIVVTHDANTKKLANGSLVVMKSHSRDLRKLDFGKGEKIPFLDEVFEEFLKNFFLINVEIKTTGVRQNGIEEKLAKTIQKFKAHHKIIVSSFNPLNLGRFHKIMPQVKTGFLLCPEENILVRNRKMIDLVKPDTLNLDHKMFPIQKHRILFELGYPLWLWTVNEEKEMRFWTKRPNVEAIITNYPDKLKAVLD
jgi:glycerophosphoryl diester phosphodiesterase